MGVDLSLPGQEPVAKLFDPSNPGTFTDAMRPPFRHHSGFNEAIRLDNGDVLFTNGAASCTPPVCVQSSSLSMVFRPDAGGGTWSLVPSCGDELTPCHLLAPLPGGKVLAHTAGGNGRRAGSTRETFVFDRQSATWSATGMLGSDQSARSGVLLSRGACAPNCGRVLATGQSASEMYTPA